MPHACTPDPPDHSIITCRTTHRQLADGSEILYHIFCSGPPHAEVMDHMEVELVDQDGTVTHQGSLFPNGTYTSNGFTSTVDISLDMNTDPTSAFGAALLARKEQDEQAREEAEAANGGSGDPAA